MTRLAAFLLGCAVTAAPLAAQPAGAPPSARELHRLRIEATPAGALPHMALPMPASRNHDYWGARLQMGYREARGGGGLPAAAAGIDYQRLGGSVIGVTAGYRSRECVPPDTDCGGHPLLGARALFNVMTGASRIGEAFGDYGANVRLGVEIGVGWAPAAVADSPACTADIGVPLVLSMFQTIRFVAYATPSLVREIDCGGEPPFGSASYTFAGGVGVQQLGHRALDVYIGAQRLLRTGSGYHFGLTVTWTRLP